MNDDVIRFHMFANGFGLIDFGSDVRPEFVEQFKKYWEEHKDDEVTP